LRWEYHLDEPLAALRGRWDPPRGSGTRDLTLTRVGAGPMSTSHRCRIG
jgi:hypothetical protein